MPTRNAHAEWRGNLKDGQGTMKLESGAYEGPYTFASRFEDGEGSNPEELIGAAHAGCFSMALSHELAEAGFPPDKVVTCAKVHLNPDGDGFAIDKIELHTVATVPDIDEDTFQKHAQGAKENCPVSKALAGPEIVLEARLE